MSRKHKPYGTTVESLLTQVGDKAQQLCDKFDQFKKEGTSVLVSGNALIAASHLYTCRVRALDAYSKDTTLAPLLEECQHDLAMCEEKIQADRVRADTTATGLTILPSPLAKVMATSNPRLSLVFPSFFSTHPWRSLALICVSCGILILAIACGRP